MRRFLSRFAPVMAAWVLCAASVSSPVLASDDLDVTMRMVTDDAELTDSVVREIELPRAPKRPEQALEPRGPGRDAARDARERGREFGQSVSERARDKADLPQRPPQAVERPQRPDLPDPANGQR